MDQAFRRGRPKVDHVRQACPERMRRMHRLDPLAPRKSAILRGSLRKQ